MHVLRKSVILAGVLVFILSSPADAQRGKKKKKAEGAEPVVQEQLTEVQVIAGKEIILTGTKKLNVAITPMTDPIRMMIDVRDMAPAPEVTRIMDINMGLIKTVRISQFANITRLEVLLKQDADFIIAREGKEATVKLEPRVEAKDETIPPELFYKAQRAQTELIMTGEITPVIDPSVMVPKGPMSGTIVTSASGIPQAVTPQSQAMTPTASYARTANRILDVKHRVSGNQVQVLVRTDGTVGEFREYTMSRPSRVIVDLIGVRGTVPRNFYNINLGPVRKVRLGEHPECPGFTRIVVDFSTGKLPAYYVTRVKGGVMIVASMEAD